MPALQCPDCEKDFSILSEASLSFCPHCRFPLVEIAGKYKLTRLLSKGGFGAVYLGLHKGLTAHAERVIKIIKPELLEVDSIGKRFQREVQLTSQLSKESPHIVHVHDDFGECPTLGYYYVMEQLQGQTLRRRLAELGGPMDTAQVHHVFGQLCEAIKVAHKARVIHRDLKPENIFLIRHKDDDSFVKVIDFGIAKPLHHEQGSLGLTQGPLGTPQYMAPEQCLHRQVDERTDIYALGVILYECLTGVPPFPFQDESSSHSYDDLVAHDVFYAHIHQPPPPMQLRTRSASFGPALEAVVQRALAKSPKQRFSQVDEFWQALSAALQEQRDPVDGWLPQAQEEPDWRATLEGEKLPPSWVPETLDAPPEDTPIPKAAPQAPGLDPMGALGPTLDRPRPPSLPPLALEDARPKGSRLPLLALLSIASMLLGGGIFLWHSSRPDSRAAASSRQRNSPPPRSQKPAKARPSKTPAKTSSPASVPPRLRRVEPSKDERSAPTSTVRAKAKKPRRRASKGSRPAPKRRRAKRPSRRAKRPSRRAKRKPRRRGFVRFVKGCPKTRGHWSFLRFVKPKQLSLARPLVTKAGRVLRKAGGYCVAVHSLQAKVILGRSHHGYIPCTFAPAKLPARIAIELQKEDYGLEPDSKGYCVKP